MVGCSKEFQVKPKELQEVQPTTNPLRDKPLSFKKEQVAATKNAGNRSIQRRLTTGKTEITEAAVN